MRRPSFYSIINVKDDKQKPKEMFQLWLVTICIAYEMSVHFIEVFSQENVSLQND